MERIRFAVTGSGWRALFYVRAAKALPEWFELTGVLCRTRERARAFSAAYGVPAVDSLDELLRGRPMFVISCVSKANMTDMVKTLLHAGMPVLSETPFATSVQGLEQLYRAQKETATLLELAEQYFLYPTHQARLAVIGRGLLGQVTSCHLSMMHDYHAMNMMRHYLGAQAEPVQICARRITAPITVTGGRAGYVTNGEMGEEVRTLAQITTANGRLGLYDFASTQYHSAIRSSHVRILGTRGELFDGQVRYLTADNRPQDSALAVHRDGITGSIRAVDFEGERVYENPLPAGVAMNEDEIAVCTLLLRMARSVRGGERHMPLRHAFADAYLSCLLHEAAEANGCVAVARMPWDE